MAEISPKVKRRIKKLEYERDDLRRKAEYFEAENERIKSEIKQVNQQNLNNFNDGGNEDE